MTVDLYCDYVGFLLVLYAHRKPGDSFVCWIFWKVLYSSYQSYFIPNLLQSYLYLINCGFVVCWIIQCHKAYVTILIFIAVHGIALLHCFADSCELGWTTVWRCVLDKPSLDATSMVCHVWTCSKFNEIFKNVIPENLDLSSKFCTIIWYLYRYTLLSPTVA